MVHKYRYIYSIVSHVQMGERAANRLTLFPSNNKWTHSNPTCIWYVSTYNLLNIQFRDIYIVTTTSNKSIKISVHNSHDLYKYKYEKLLK